MSPNAKRKKKKKAGITQYAKDKNLAALSLDKLAPCWCEGFPNGCGKILARSARYLHASNVKRRRERGIYDALRAFTPANIPQEPAPALQLQLPDLQAIIQERQRQHQEDQLRVPMEANQYLDNYPPDDGPLFGNDDFDVPMRGEDQPDNRGDVINPNNPEVVVLFALEAEDHIGVVNQAPDLEPADPDKPEIVWDQAQAQADADDAVLQEVERAQWEETQRRLVEQGEWHVGYTRNTNCK